MSDTVISVSHLSKVYRLGTIGSSTLKDDLNRLWARIRGQPDPTKQIGSEHHQRKEGGVFWALQDVSFDVNQGEVLGIIGKNGAGKSTLLKILSRVTAPTHGEVRVRGRIASLLEVGTGFHPDLSGRENVSLNGAIMGMSKAEIRSKFDEIVAFSGVEEFIDTPVKRYSSGMYVRLAFAVAAHLEPEILVLDEVLSVGDAEFQKRCLGKMSDVARSGRTVLFVSHNMAAVRALCSRVILLKSGGIAKQGDAVPITEKYLEETIPSGAYIMDLRALPRTGSVGSRVILTKVVFNDGNPLFHGKSAKIELHYEVKSAVQEVAFGLGFSTSDGTRIMTVDSDIPGQRISYAQGQTGKVQCFLDTLQLAPDHSMHTWARWAGRLSLIT